MANLSQVMALQAMPDGLIGVDSGRGKSIGLIGQDFDASTYLWKEGRSITISFIWCMRKGAFRELVERIRSAGMAVKIPTPMGDMERIVRQNGYQQTWEWSSGYQCDVEVWVLQ